MALWQPYLIAIVIGLLVGLEREKFGSSKNSFGVRTFLLISLLGALSGGIDSVLLSTVLAAFALSLIVISYFSQVSNQKPGEDHGLTTEFAAGVVFCLGYAAHQSPALSAIIGPIVALILFSKPEIRRFSHAIKRNELEAALLLLLAAVVVVNLLPDRLVGPGRVFNPKKFGFIVLILATLEFSSYILAKILGSKNGAVAVGFLGGIVSSTAVLLSSARRASKTPADWRILAASAVSAKLAAILEALLIIGLVAPSLLISLVPVIGVTFLVGVMFLFFVLPKSRANAGELALKSPLDWRGVFRLAIILAAILATISVVKELLGEKSILAISFITGLFELHGVTLANATVFSNDKLSSETAFQSIVAALIASLVAKIAVSWMITRTKFSQTITLIFGIMILAAIIIGGLMLKDSF